LSRRAKASGFAAKASVSPWRPGRSLAGEPRDHDRPDSTSTSAGMNAVWPWPEQLEGIVAAPASHRILLETPALRVLEIVIEPGAREPEHVHRHSSVMIVDRPARIRYYESGRLTFESEETVGEPVARAMWMNPEGPHSVENIDTSRYRAFRVEVLG
jgi:quercetin dioxygenase-like cupin family protein